MFVLKIIMLAVDLPIFTEVAPELHEACNWKVHPSTRPICHVTLDTSAAAIFDPAKAASSSLFEYQKKLPLRKKK